jgi:hypothetical protein
MKRYTLSVYDNIVKEPVMTVQVDEFSCTHGEDGASVRAGKDATEPRTSFMNTTFNIEQKFAPGFDPEKVAEAVRANVQRVMEKRMLSETSRIEAFRAEMEEVMASNNPLDASARYVARQVLAFLAGL